MTTNRTRRIIPIALLALAAVSIAGTADAQTGACPTTSPGFQVNPSRGCFRPATDPVGGHTATDPISGAPVVDHYEVAYFAEGADVATQQPIQAPTSIGKPNPNAQASIWYGQGTATPLPAYPVGIRVKAVIDAVGPTGNRSPRGSANTSNPFGQAGPLAVPAAPSSHTVTGG